METQLPPAKCPSELLERARQRPTRSQRVTAPTAPRSRWQPWRDWPGTECDILGSLAGVWGWGEWAGSRVHPSTRLTARSISLKGQPSAHPSPAQNPSVAAHHPTESRPKQPPLCIPSPSQAGPRLPHRLISCQSLPELSAPAKWICCSANKLFSQSPTPTPLFAPSLWECPSPIIPSSFSLPCLSLPTLKAHQIPHLPDTSLTPAEVT